MQMSMIHSHDPSETLMLCTRSFQFFMVPSILRIASYLSFAANACGAAVNSGALCIGDWTALMANFGEMATVGAAVKEDCDFTQAGEVGWAVMGPQRLGKRDDVCTC